MNVLLDTIQVVLFGSVFFVVVLFGASYGVTAVVMGWRPRGRLMAAFLVWLAVSLPIVYWLGQLSLHVHAQPGEKTINLGLCFALICIITPMLSYPFYQLGQWCGKLFGLEPEPFTRALEKMTEPRTFKSS